MPHGVSSAALSYVGRRNARPLRVLVVDDDDDSRELVAVAITQGGDQCVTAKDGEEAWEKLQKEPVDAILSDWSMPRMSGLELCRLVRAKEDMPYVYFVLLTGRQGKAQFFEGMRAGADDYLTKPVDLDVLRARFLSAVRVIEMQRDLSQRNADLRRQSELSFKIARVDPLTESANRLRLREDLDALQSRVARYGHRYCAALCDVDFFKRYNDTCGHIAGDDALRRIASTMGTMLRQGDTLYRYGGEEFLVILPGQDPTEAQVVMNRLREGVSDLGILPLADGAGALTISVGIAELVNNGETCDEWLKRADAALYCAKHAGRNRVELARPVTGRA